jgi:phosphopantetheine adenylyltransferase
MKNEDIDDFKELNESFGFIRNLQNFPESIVSPETLVQANLVNEIKNLDEGI